jgi:hypothetical protein
MQGTASSTKAGRRGAAVAQEARELGTIVMVLIVNIIKAECCLYAIYNFAYTYTLFEPRLN